MQASAESQQGAGRTMSKRQAVAWEASLGLCAVALCLLCARELRSALLWGAAASLLAGFVSLPAVLVGLEKGTSGLFAGMVVGFLCRLLFVALGFVASGVHGREALPFVFAFFAVFAATVGVEIAYVAGHARRAGTSEPR
jgi:hypothetical protein